MYDPTPYLASKLLNGIFDAISDRDEAEYALTRVLQKSRDNIQKIYPDLYEHLVLNINQDAIYNELVSLLSPHLQHNPQRLAQHFKINSATLLENDTLDKLQHYFIVLKSEISKEPCLAPVLQHILQESHADALEDIKAGQENIEALIRSHIPIETHIASLKELERHLRAEYKETNFEDRATLEKEIETLCNKIEHQQQSYEERITLLVETIQALEAYKSQLSEQDYDAAQAALLAGDMVKAEELFAQVEANESDAIERAAEAAYQQGKIVENRFDYRKAFQHFERAARLKPDTSKYLVSVGSLADDIALYDKAIEYIELALRLEKTKYGESSPQVVVHINSLGIVWSNKGDYDKAIEYYELALESFLKIYGQDRPEIATCRNNLGMAWNHKGDYGKAIKYYELALASDMKIFGPDHPAVARDQSNLAEVWYKKGDYDKAIQLYEFALKSDLKSFGPSHPRVAIRRGGIGEVLYEKGEYDKAIEYHKLALEADLKCFGKYHPAVARDKNNLGMAWNKKGEYDKAIKYFKQALEINNKVGGVEHPQISIRRNNLGGVYASKGDFDKAIHNYEQALESGIKAYGLDHPNVANYKYNIGAAWYRKGEYSKALMYFRDALSIYDLKLGVDHPTTLKVKENYERLRKLLNGR